MGRQQRGGGYGGGGSRGGGRSFELKSVHTIRSGVGNAARPWRRGEKSGPRAEGGTGVHTYAVKALVALQTVTLQVRTLLRAPITDALAEACKNLVASHAVAPWSSHP